MAGGEGDDRDRHRLPYMTDDRDQNAERTEIREQVQLLRADLAGPSDQVGPALLSWVCLF